MTSKLLQANHVCRWIAQNELGYKLDRKKGQWIVAAVLFSDFLEHVSSCPGADKPYYRFSLPRITSFRYITVSRENQIEFTQRPNLMGVIGGIHQIVTVLDLAAGQLH